MECADVNFSCKLYRHDVGDFQSSKMGSNFTSPFATCLSSHESSPQLTGKLVQMDCVCNRPRTHEDFGGASARARNLRLRNDEFQECIALVNLLKTYSYQKDLAKGSKVHADILKTGLLRKDTYLGTALLRMYVKCGVLAKAQEVFDELPVRDVTSWTVLMSGYTEQGLGDAALKIFGQMKDEGVSPDAVTYICVLKACGSIKAGDRGEEIHSEVSRKALLENNIVLGTTLVDMYGKCGSLAKAKEVFDELPGRDVAAWTALIAGYAQHGHGAEALSCYAQMRNEGLFPNAVTFVCMLKACGSIRATEMGKDIHAELKRLDLLGKNIMIDNALVDMYAKCGVLEKAQEVFDWLPERNLASWTALLCGYTEHGLGDKALYYFGRMQDGGTFPDSVLFACILRACGSIGAAEQGKKLHADANRLGLLQKHGFLGNALVDMYAKCGMLIKAQQVLDELLIKDVPTWNMLMSGYLQCGLDMEALKCYEMMQEKGLSPNAVTFICTVRACGSLGAMEKGEEIHAEVSRQGLLERHIELGNALVDMYAKWGVIATAQKVFDKLPLRDVVSWTTLINGYVKHGDVDEALDCLKQMQKEGISPDAATFTCILKACSMVGAAEKGEEIHNEVRRLGLLEKHAMLSTALVDMYAKCGNLARAQEAFDESPIHDVVSWTALIAGYVESGLGDEAVNCFKQMQEEGLSPDAATFVCTLKACSIVGAIEKGEEIHAEIGRQGLLGKHVDLGTALVDMYAKCGALARAQEVFDKLPVRDAISWSALIAGYVENGVGDEALMCFERMQIEGFFPDAATFISISKACGSLGITEKGREIHAEVDRQHLLETNKVLSIALLDMYAKCGVLLEAQEIFNNLPEQNVVSWTALMTGYAQLGNIDRVFDSFDKMIEDLIEPNIVTFNVLLSACSHAGLVEEGQLYFVKMNTAYSFSPNLEHYNCMVDLFSRAGRFDEAIGIIKEGPHSDCLLLWLALLGACQNWVIVELGRWAFEHAVRLDGGYSAAFACMRNIYAAAGMQEEAQRLETMRTSVKYRLQPG